MDSLLANYASSDDEEDNSQQEILLPNSSKLQEVKGDSISKSNSFFSSLPLPKSSSSSLSFSLPPPKSRNATSTAIPSKPPQDLNEEGEPKSNRNLGASDFPTPLHKPSSSLFSSLPLPQSSSASSLFSSLPPPKTDNDEAQIASVSSSSVSNRSGPAGKKVIQFRPPPMAPTTRVSNEDGDEDDEDDKEEKNKKLGSSIETSSVKSFLSSIPAPKNSLTLGALPSASGSGRRSILEADVPASNDSPVVGAVTYSETGFDTNQGQYSEHAVSGDYSNWNEGNVDYAHYTSDYVNSDGYASHGNTVSGTDDYSNWNGGNFEYANCSSDYASYGQYSSNWADESTATVAPQKSGLTESAFRVSGKRGRNDAPTEIVEVKQDELMKNRPREDQVKLTGIAFGPAYQPASTKGKPSKLHKRKHQIGSLYFDMKQKETELAERRAKGFLTKAQTQGKYGW